MSDPSDMSLLDLFRMEVETHAAALEQGLVGLEAQPDALDRIEPLMRAAHSIKGAARIVGLNGAVGLAHAMEDVFVAIQQRTLRITAEATDRLLGGLDLFKRLAAVEPGGMEAWIEARREFIEGEVKALRAFLEDAPADTAPADTARPAAPAPAAAPAAGSATVPVAPERLNRLIGLAGEALVESQRLEGLTRQLDQLKAGQKRLAVLVDDLGERPAGGPRADALLAAAATGLEECGERLAGIAVQFEEYALRAEGLATRLYHEAVAVRMRPFRDALHGFPRLVRDLARDLGKLILLQTSGEDTPVDRDLLAQLEAPLTHLLRNACDHGIETPAEREAAGKPPQGTIRLEAEHRAGMVRIRLSDDGRGVDREAVRRRVIERNLADPGVAGRLGDGELLDFLFLPGFSTATRVSELSGRGVGLDVVQNLVREVGGTVRLRSEPGRGAEFELVLPLTLSVLRALTVRIAGEAYALPLARAHRVLKIGPAEDSRSDRVLNLDGSRLPLVSAAAALNMEAAWPAGDWSVVVLDDRVNRCGLVVDAILGMEELVAHPLDARLGRLPGVSAAAILGDGAAALILDADDLVRAPAGAPEAERAADAPAAAPAAEKTILVVEDSLTVRETERRLLEQEGYRVETAADGLEGWSRAHAGRYDLIITDVDMPRMNGIELIRQIQADPRLRGTPVMIVSYKDREEDRLRGLEAGAAAYLAKGGFQSEALSRAVRELIGDP